MTLEDQDFLSVFDWFLSLFKPKFYSNQHKWRFASTFFVHLFMNDWGRASSDNIKHVYFLKAQF